MGTDDVALVVPWRETPDRVTALAVATRWWKQYGLTPEHHDTGSERFNLAASRNLGVHQAAARGARVVVVADADTFPDQRPLLEAIDAARTSGLVHLPYTQYRSLGPAGTRRLAIDDLLPHEVQYHPVAGSCSGVFVSSPATWWSIGGMDERFTVWAPEDYAFRIAHETLLGAQPRHIGNAYALHHEDQPGKASGPDYEACVSLYQQYIDAVGQPDAMRQLLGLT